LNEPPRALLRPFRRLTHNHRFRYVTRLLYRIPVPGRTDAFRGTRAFEYAEPYREYHWLPPPIFRYIYRIADSGNAPVISVNTLISRIASLLSPTRRDSLDACYRNLLRRLELIIIADDIKSILDRFAGFIGA
jgi:hypothetical protein